MVDLCYDSLYMITVLAVDNLQDQNVFPKSIVKDDNYVHKFFESLIRDTEKDFTLTVTASKKSNIPAVSLNFVKYNNMLFNTSVVLNNLCLSFF